MKAFLTHRIRQIRRVGPAAAVRLAWDRSSRAVSSKWSELVGTFRPTGLASWTQESAPQRLVPPLSLAPDGAEDGWLNHTFDLLGSGPQSLNLRIRDPLLDLPKAWAGTAKRLRAMLPDGYQLIDWQLDPKSGHRWSARDWFRKVVYGHLPGVDVKWPWELARLQHLPPMAGRLATATPERRALLRDEIRAEVIDFVLQNPPGFGVNWVCAMDVGIRAANLTLAVDLARASGTDFDDTFLSLVCATLRDHGRYIAANLEWGATLCSNHYLANIVGLLFVGAYLPPGTEADDWLAFAGRELVLQLRTQFYPDGSNFEASTCYHRLSAEMMTYGAAIMLRSVVERPSSAGRWWSGAVPRFHPAPDAPVLTATAADGGINPPFDASDRRRLLGMGQFTAALLRKDGSIPQIGDNDSGRFVRLGLASDAYRDLWSHAHLPAAVNALFGQVHPFGDTPEAEWLRRWLGDATLCADVDREPVSDRFVEYRQFGLYVWNRPGFRLTFRCGPVGQNGNGGHAHSDQLAITIDVDGQPVVIDAGTGVYTPDPDCRNRFRSVLSHSTIVVPGSEPNEWLPGRWGLFAMKDRSKARVISVGPDGVEAEHSGYGRPVRRTVRLNQNSIELEDEDTAAHDDEYVQLVLSPTIRVVQSADRCCLELGEANGAITIETLGSVRVRDISASPSYGITVQTQAAALPLGRWRLKLA